MTQVADSPTKRITAVSIDQLYAEHLVVQQEVDSYAQHLVALQEAEV